MYVYILCVCVREIDFGCYCLVTGWQNPIGCLKLQVISRKRATHNKAFWWKMIYVCRTVRAR